MNPDAAAAPLSRRLATREDLPRHVLAGAGGLRIELRPHGGVHAIQHGSTLLNQWLSHPLEEGLTRLYLRRRDGTDACTALIGPASPSAFAAGEGRAHWTGTWQGLAYEVRLELDDQHPLWLWRVRIRNTRDTQVDADVLYGQDLGLADAGAVRNNEAYVSHYLDHAVEQDAGCGPVVMTRQNQSQAGGRHPWLMQGCLEGGRAFSTDGFQFFGLSHKASGVPAACRLETLPAQRLQYEFAYTGLQSGRICLPPGAEAETGFFAWYEADHAAPSSREDLARLPQVRASASRLVERPPLRPASPPAPPDAWLCAPLEAGRPVPERVLQDWFGAAWRQVERTDGRLQSFFHGAAEHVVLAAKELACERPHGAILRSGQSLYPEAETLSATCYAYGVFAAQVTVGNTSFHKLLSVARHPLNTIRTSGLRIFLRAGGEWRMLGVPTAFATAPGACRWFYQLEDGLVVVQVAAGAERPVLRIDLEVRDGPAREFLLAHDLVLGEHELDRAGCLEMDAAAGRMVLRPGPGTLAATHVPGLAFLLSLPEPDTVAELGGAELLAPGAAAADRIPCAAVRTRPVRAFTLKLHGSTGGRLPDHDHAPRPCRCPDATDRFLATVLRSTRLEAAAAPGVARLQEILPWFTQQALIHLTVPHGLEQYGGAAWGTRDVCQGPVEFLLALRHHEPVRRILRKVYAHQYRDTAEWPQWFMFDEYHTIQQDHCHGDVIFWPLKALADYLEATGDFALLQEPLPYAERAGFSGTAASAPLLDHVRRQVDRIEQMFVPGTALVRYGDGDWDDTLQPADESLRTRMVSGWTVELCFQVLAGWAAAAARAGLAGDAERAARLAADVQRDFNRFLVRDGVAAGFLVREPDGSWRPLLHPQDRVTGIRYRLLPMTRGIISGLFSPEQAQAHLELIRQHLLFADGARLMSDAVAYRGGISTLFKRGETSAYFGREVSLQYTHAHIRYAEAMARLGRGADFWKALQAVNPVALAETVASAAPRQANAYFSSSDGAFADRYEAFARYRELKDGRVPVKGGWRIYSSGPGIYLRQVFSHWLGVRLSCGDVVIDPVLDRTLDGLRWSGEFEGRSVTWTYRVREGECGPRRIRVNGRDLDFTRDTNPYRAGGARITRDALLAALGPGGEVDVFL
jgi:cellobiose phosphorylase